MLTYPQWKLNRQIAYGLIVLVAVVVIIAGVVRWQQDEVRKRPAEV